jgi:ubiquinone/menaquinone biosynthesis C-methylase UbiE
MAILTYFEQKASRYDEVDEQPYWAFSDRLLWKLLKERFLPEESAKETLLDAGCGTGRWSYRIWLEYPQFIFKMVDFSTSMLEVAKQKMQNAKAEFYCKDLHELSQFSANRALALHNVLGFVRDIRLVLELLFKGLETGGVAALMFPSFYHALYFSNVTGRMQEVVRILKHRQVCYNDLMPPLQLFEIDEVTTLLEQIGFREVTHHFLSWDGRDLSFRIIF